MLSKYFIKTYRELWLQPFIFEYFLRGALLNSVKDAFLAHQLFFSFARINQFWCIFQRPKSSLDHVSPTPTRRQFYSKEQVFVGTQRGCVCSWTAHVKNCWKCPRPRLYKSHFPLTCKFFDKIPITIFCRGQTEYLIYSPSIWIPQRGNRNMDKNMRNLTFQVCNDQI